MESSFRREDVLSEYITQRSLENSPSDDMDMDFNDVFGGPPRRFSVQETRVRYSFGESLESEEDAADLTRSSLSGLNEKPVFGAENGNRRRRQGNDFYNDIFKAKGDESYSSPRRTDRDPFGSNPGSRVLSPARPLPPKVEPFDTAQFSLPAKLTKATDLPVFASGVHSPHKSKDATAIATSTSLFRLSGHAIQREKEMKNDIPTLYQQSPLSREVSVSSDELRYMAESDEKGIGGHMKKNPESTDASSNAQQFHFSIYKWAGKGVPLLMPLRGLRGGKHFKSKENITIERCSSSNGRMEINSNMDISLPAGENLNIFKDANSDSSRTTSKKEVSGDKNNKKPYGIAGETLDNPESNSLQSVQYTIVVDGPILSTEIEGEEPQSRQRTGLFVGVDKQVPRNSDETSKTELKPLSAFLTNEAKEQDNRKMAEETKGKSSMAKTTQATESDVKVNNNMKKTDVVADKKLKKGDAEVTNNTRKSDSGANRNGKRGVGNKVTSDKGGINSGSISGSSLRSSENSTKAGIKGKVQDFVKKFNQDVNSTPKEVESRSQSFRRKASSNNGLDSEKSFGTHQENEKVQLPTMNKMQDPTDNEGQNLNQENMTKYSQTKTSTPHTKNISDQKAAPLITESIQDDPRVSAGSMDDIFHGNYVVEEIFEDHDMTSHANGKSEDIQASDAKVHQWLQGRKGNIRSLLSTLQNVLWPESGWKPVPLVDLIEGKAVKRSYQRALLYLHPDKLQQKGAAAHQKYIAEKVFEILQEAWDHFNSVGAI